MKINANLKRYKIYKRNMESITIIGFTVVFFYCLIQLLGYFGVGTEVYGKYLYFYLFLHIKIFISAYRVLVDHNGIPRTDVISSSHNLPILSPCSSIDIGNMIILLWLIELGILSRKILSPLFWFYSLSWYMSKRIG